MTKKQYKAAYSALRTELRQNSFLFDMYTERDKEDEELSYQAWFNHELKSLLYYYHDLNVAFEN